MKAEWGPRMEEEVANSASILFLLINLSPSKRKCLKKIKQLIDLQQLLQRFDHEPEKDHQPSLISPPLPSLSLPLFVSIPPLPPPPPTPLIIESQFYYLQKHHKQKQGSKLTSIYT